MRGYREEKIDITRRYSNVRIAPDRSYLRSSRHDSGTRHPEKMKIETGDDSAVEGRASSRPHVCG